MDKARSENPGMPGPLEGIKIVESYWKVLPRISYGEGSMLGAALFANSRDYHKLGIGLMDSMIIKSALDGKHLIWTLDSRINKSLDHNQMYQSGILH